MKHFFLALFILAFYSISYAQNPVADAHPGAQIYVIDPQSGQEIPAASDNAILFKNSLIELVRNTSRARAILARVAREMPNRIFTITQMGVETNVNGYQIVLDEQAQDQNQGTNIYTFVFHVDDHTLYFYDPATQNWSIERIMPDNSFNLRKALTYAQRFDEEIANQPPSDQNDQIGIDASVDLNQPVDADVAADTPPPVMPEYEQPECPSDGYLWQPGYWAYAPGRSDYYWVPGAWVAPPTPGVLWTPPYWGYEGNRYIFHIGYWGDHIGFYGGINYGYGYSGRGYDGGEWRGGHFRYNTAVVRVNTRVVRNTYVNRIVISTTVRNNRNSFNGGRGGVDARPTKEEIVATREHHLKPTPEQNGNQLQARENPHQFTKGNPGGKPANLARPKVMPFQPKNNNSNKGANPANGGRPNPNQPQGTNPGRPNGQGTNPGRPNGQGTNPGRPNGQGANPVNPNGQGTNPANPNGQRVNHGKPNEQGANPGKPDVQGTNPAQPQGQGTNPGQPNGQKANPAQPQGQGTNPGQPNGQKTNPAQPQGQGTNPGQPNGQRTNPAQPQGQGTNPGQPNGQRTNPGQPNGQRTNPGQPQGQRANPVNPAGQRTNPAQPQGQGTNAGKPNVQPVKPVKPQVEPTKPVKQKEPKQKPADQPAKQ